VVHNAVIEATASAQAPLAKVRRVVLGSPGLVDPSTGDMSFAFDLPRWQRGLLGALREDLKRTVVFENDVNLAAVAEAHTGAAQGVDDFVLLWLARGVGMAVMLGGKLHRGVSGAAGEVGYLPVAGVPVPRDVARRAKGGFKELAGADAVRTLACEHGFRAPTAQEAVRAAVNAGTAGGPVLDELARRLALGLSAACLVLDPALVVLAGEVGRAGGVALAHRVQQEVAAIAPVSPRVVVSETSGQPVLHGALITALHAARDELFGSTID
jgi:predicted NBD/HSP70 family sugar kinase